MAAGTAPRRGAAAAAPSLLGVVIALQSVVITYGGWQSALYFAEEDRDPSRNLPRSTVGGLLLVLIVYVLVNAALLALLPLPALSRSTLPAADAAALVLGARGAVAITLLSLLSLPPMLNAIMMIGTRILFAMGRDGLFWSRTSEVSAGGTPSVAMLVTTAVALGLIRTGTFQRLVAIVSIFLAANYCVCCVALFALRRSAKSAAAPVPRPGVSVVGHGGARGRARVPGGRVRRRHPQRCRRRHPHGGRPRRPSAGYVAESNGRSIDCAGPVKNSPPRSVTWKQSSSRMPNSA